MIIFWQVVGVASLCTLMVLAYALGAYNERIRMLNCLMRDKDRGMVPPESTQWFLDYDRQHEGLPRWRGI